MTSEGEHYLTKEKLEELKKELEYLKTKKRMQVAERLKRAKEFGDLSENSEYSDAKDQQMRVETRVYELEEVIKNAVIIKEGDASGVATMGSTVTAKGNGDARTYKIVGSNETNPTEGRISNDSPLGQAFIGKKAGDNVIIKTPKGALEYRIIKVK